MCCGAIGAGQSAPGTLTVSLRHRTPATTASATAPRAVLGNAAGRRAVLRVLTNPGRASTPWTPEPRSASPSPVTNAPSPAPGER